MNWHIAGKHRAVNLIYNNDNMFLQASRQEPGGSCDHLDLGFTPIRDGSSRTKGSEWIELSPLWVKTCQVEKRLLVFMNFPLNTYCIFMTSWVI